MCPQAPEDFDALSGRRTPRRLWIRVRKKYLQKLKGFGGCGVNGGCERYTCVGTPVCLSSAPSFPVLTRHACLVSGLRAVLLRTHNARKSANSRACEAVRFARSDLRIHGNQRLHWPCSEPSKRSGPFESHSDRVEKIDMEIS